MAQLRTDSSSCWDFDDWSQSSYLRSLQSHRVALSLTWKRALLSHRNQCAWCAPLGHAQTETIELKLGYSLFPTSCRVYQLIQRLLGRRQLQRWLWKGQTRSQAQASIQPALFTVTWALVAQPKCRILVSSQKRHFQHYRCLQSLVVSLQAESHHGLRN